MVFTTVDQSLLGPYQSSASTFLGIGRNRFVNGEMLIDQANEGSILSISTAGYHYGADQWWGYGTSAAGVFRLTKTSGTPPINFQAYTHIDVTTQSASPAAGALYLFGQNLEGYSIRDFLWGTVNAKTVALSFWVRSNLTGTFAGAIQNFTGTRSYVFNYTINSANTWEQKSMSIPGETTGTWVTNANAAVQFQFDLGTGSTYQGTAGVWSSSNVVTTAGANRIITSTSNTLDFTGIQLELGLSATAYEYKTFDVMLAQCQRYYEKSNAMGTKPATNPSDTFYGGFGIATNSHNIPVPMKVRKRVTPTAFIWDDQGTANQSYYQTSTSSSGRVAASAVQITDTFLGFNAAAPTGAAVYLNFQWVADARV